MLWTPPLSVPANRNLIPISGEAEAASEQADTELIPPPNPCVEDLQQLWLESVSDHAAGGTADGGRNSRPETTTAAGGGSSGNSLGRACGGGDALKDEEVVDVDVAGEEWEGEEILIERPAGDGGVNSR